ncbi:MAG: methyltransferase domain-containing protein [Armatimonadia bacterium]|nr:methyltransferase domain-containing protein [Armatimonadia bacterium]
MSSGNNGKTQERSTDTVAGTCTQAGVSGAAECCGEFTACGSIGAERAPASEADLRGLELEPHGPLVGPGPGATEQVRLGDVVVEVASAGGLDCFVSAQQAGATGRVIGLRTSARHLAVARENALLWSARAALPEIEFRLMDGPDLPVKSGEANAVISFGGLSGAADPGHMWREMYRVLAPAGRISVSELALLNPSLPPDAHTPLSRVVGDVSSLRRVDEVYQLAMDAGFSDIRLNPRPEGVDAIGDRQPHAMGAVQVVLPDGRRLRDYITLLEVQGVKWPT